MPSVFPEWMAELPMQQQSVLVLALRGPDGYAKFHICKDVIRAYRGSVLKAAKYGRSLAFGEKADSFMSMDKIADMEAWTAAVNDFLLAMDELPMHQVLHLAHGAHILAERHPNRKLRERWQYFYHMVVEAMHMDPEPVDIMNQRLGDWGRKHWDQE